MFTVLAQGHVFGEFLLQTVLDKSVTSLDLLIIQGFIVKILLETCQHTHTHTHTHTHSVERPCVVWVGESKLIHSVRSQGNTYRDDWEVVGRQEQRCREQTCGHSGGRRGQDKLRA